MADAPDRPAADNDLSTEEGARRWRLDLETVAKRGLDDIANGRVFAHDAAMAELDRRRAARTAPQPQPVILPQAAARRRA